MVSRRTPIYRALYRPNLILGGERELVLLSALLCGGIAVSGLNLVSIAIGLSVWLLSLAGLRLMAKADPHMSKIYLAFLRYRPYYPARSRRTRIDQR
jgi:type IV secretion system protein VirB3